MAAAGVMAARPPFWWEVLMRADFNAGGRHLAMIAGRDLAWQSVTAKRKVPKGFSLHFLVI